MKGCRERTPQKPWENTAEDPRFKRVIAAFVEAEASRKDPLEESRSNQTKHRGAKRH